MINLNDKRNQRRIKKAIGFTTALLSSDKPREMSTRFIDKHFGISSNPVSRYLRDTLLICTDDSYNKDRRQCKKYVINKTGLSELLNRSYNNNIMPIYPSVLHLQELALDWAKTEYKSQLDTLKFDYEEKSHRLYNPIQNIKSEVRTKLLADRGLRFDYDIDTCAPTLLYQYSFLTPDATGEVLEVIEDYIENKAQRRQQLADDAEITVTQAKQLINALFAGAHLSTFPDSALFKLIDRDYAKMRYLQQHPYLMGLRANIKTMWEPIRCQAPVIYYADKNGKKRRRPFNGRAKWDIYFKLERQVLNEIRDYLHLPEVRSEYFLEHDGFRTHKPIDTQDLSYWIQAGTDFKLKFKEVIH